MFDAEYFTDLLEKTLSISESLSAQSEDNKKRELEANVLTLNYLVENIEDGKVREDAKRRLGSLLKGPVAADDEDKKDRRFNRKADSRKRSEALEGDLLEYARLLRRKAAEFSEKLNEDERVVEKTGEAFSRNVAGTQKSIGEILREGKTLPVFQIFVGSLVVFLLMYILVRFF